MPKGIMFGHLALWERNDSGQPERRHCIKKDLRVIVIDSRKDGAKVAFASVN